MHATRPPSPAVEAFLRRRSRRRRVGGVLLLLLSTSILLGNGWHHARGGDDWSRFDRKSFLVRAVIAGDRMTVETIDGRTSADIQLLGIDAPDVPPAGQTSHGSAEALAELKSRVEGKLVLLRLPPLEPRTDDGFVRAYVHVPGDQAGPAVSVNEQLVAAGHAYADRRTGHPFHKQFEQAEADARKRRRGLWDGVRDDQQPAWRQAWLKQLQAERANRK